MNVFKAPSYRTYTLRDEGVVMHWMDKSRVRTTLIYPDIIYSVYAKEDTIIGTDDYKAKYSYIGATEELFTVDPKSVVNAKYYTDEFLNACYFPKDNSTAYMNAKRSANCLVYSNKVVIPTIQCLVRIFCDRHFIDSIDSRFHISNWFDDLPVPFAWSSTKMDWYYMWCVSCSGSVGGIGKSDLQGAVIPIKEL